MREGLADERILVHISRLMVSGGSSAVKETGGAAPMHAAALLATNAKSWDGFAISTDIRACY